MSNAQGDDIQRSARSTTLGMFLAAHSNFGTRKKAERTYLIPELLPPPPFLPANGDGGTQKHEPRWKIQLIARKYTLEKGSSQKSRIY